MATEMWSGRLEKANYTSLKALAAERGVSMAQLVNEILTAVLPQIRPDVKFVWLSIENIGK